MKVEQIPAVQNWLPIEEILDKGIIKMKDSSYIKILHISPINYNLKSDLEKEAILNSYTNFFKSSNFNLQVLIQSKKEDLEKHISILEKQKNIKKTPKEKQIFDNYIEYIKKSNLDNKSSSKNFYIVISQNNELSKKGLNNLEKIIIENLNEKYFKIKETLSRCGNIVYETDKKEVIDIMYSFFNYRKNQVK